MSEQSRLGTLFDYAATHLPKGTMQFGSPSPIVGEPTTHPYDRLAGVVEELSGWFRAMGIAPGSSVAIAKQNHPDMCLVAGAAARAGLLPALISAAVPAEQAPILLDRLNPAAVVADSDVITAWDLTNGRWRVIDVDSTTPGAIPADDLRGTRPAPAQPADPAEPMVITHTSGTTGVPKLVAHSANTLLARSRIVSFPIPVLSIRRRDRYAAYLPWNHARTVEFFTSSLHTGCPVLALSDPAPDTASPLLRAFRPTLVEFLPDVYLRWEALAQPNSRLFRHIRLFLNAFDAVHPRTVRAFLSSAPGRALWIQGYGQSEIGGASVAAYTRRSVRPRRNRPPTLRNMGWPPWPMARVRVTDPETGDPVPKGAVGQFEVKTRGRVLTYVGQEALHRRRVRGDWWTTGDIGHRTPSGRVILHDRHIDLLPGIESCLEVEDRLLDALPEATEVVLVNLNGESVPVVCTNQDRALDPDRWAEATLSLDVTLAPPIQLPWSAVPRTGTFKVRRRALVEYLLDGGMRDAVVPAGERHAVPAT